MSQLLLRMAGSLRGEQVRLDHTQAALTAERAIAAVRADPIKAFRFSSYAQRRFFQAFHKYREVLLRAASNAGKTHVGAHLFVGVMRGVKTVCGDIVGVRGVIERGEPVSLPLVGTPVSGIVLAQGREMSKESVLKAIRFAIGTHPHHEERNGNVVAAIWVKPDSSRSDDWHDWSCIRFFVEDGQSVAGMRLDFAWADEPPKWDMWVECRMRGRANRPFLRAITATPIDKRTWKAMRTDYKLCEDRPEGKDGKVEIRMSVYDNKMLGPAHIKQVEQDSKGLLQDAKLLGDYVDTTGQNPFSAKDLKRWKERCFDPIATETWNTASGERIEYQIWEAFKAEQAYMVIADPSAGIHDEAEEHDPAGIVVIACRAMPKPYVVARFNGYVTAANLGRLARHLAESYGNAFLVWENNSGYGEAFFEGTKDKFGGEYRNVYFELHTNVKNQTEKQVLGWTTTGTTRGTLVGALQRAIEEDGLFVWSYDAVDSLQNVTLKRDGLRPEAGAGSHDEDMIVLGIGCHLLETRSVPMPTPLSALETLRANGVFKPLNVTPENEFVDF